MEMGHANACENHLGKGPSRYFDRAIFHAEYCDLCLDIVIATIGLVGADVLRREWRMKDGCKLHLQLVRDVAESRAVFLARNYPCCLRELTHK